MELPEELIIHIFSSLSKNELAVASLVCRAWNRLSNSDSLWKLLLAADDIRWQASPKVVEKFQGAKNIFKFCQNSLQCPTFPLLGGLPYAAKLPAHCGAIHTLMFWIYLESSCTGHLRLFLREKSFYLGVASHCNQIVWSAASWMSYSQRSSNWYATSTELPVRVWTHVTVLLQPNTNEPPSFFFGGKPVGGRPARPASMTLRGSKYATGQLSDIRAFCESSSPSSSSSSVARRDFNDADEDLNEIRMQTKQTKNGSQSPLRAGRLVRREENDSASVASFSSSHSSSLASAQSKCRSLIPLFCSQAPRVAFTMQEEMHNNETRPLPVQHSQRCSQCAVSPIAGVLYSCIECSHFLCESCFAAPQSRRRGAVESEHTPDHNFQPYRLPFRKE